MALNHFVATVSCVSHAYTQNSLSCSHRYIYWIGTQRKRIEAGSRDEVICCKIMLLRGHCPPMIIHVAFLNDIFTASYGEPNMTAETVTEEIPIGTSLLSHLRETMSRMRAISPSLCADVTITLLNRLLLIYKSILK